MPRLQIPSKMARVLTTKARVIVLIGGRSSGKSEGVGRILMMKAQTESADILCGREYQNSIDDSVHKLLSSLVGKLGVEGANVRDNKIDFMEGGGFRYKGFSRNSEAVKSAQDFKYSWVEEAQNISQASIDDLLPTIRSKGSKLFFTANPQSSEDPFSKRFIMPFLADILDKGSYEDDMHLIIMMNWRDNPWHGELESQRLWDYENLPRAKYDWIWEGAFNDSVDDALIMSEWFDACIDAHLKLGFSPVGARMSSHDPSDMGEDSKGYAFRHGSVVLDAQEKKNGNINEGGDWATGLAIGNQSDTYTWDCDGMGVGLARQTDKAFEGKGSNISMFKGSESPDYPDSIYSPSNKSDIANQKTNKEVFKNKRAQYYFLLRDRIHNTYRAVAHGEYHDPDEMLSFSSKIECLSKIRAEVCRIPVKPNANGLCELYTKPTMKSKFGIASPNLADSIMMLMRQPHRVNKSAHIPRPIKQMGRR